MEQLPVISIHIEKTAGTSLERFFLETFSPDKVLIYSALTDTLVKASLKEWVRTDPLVDRIRGRFRNSPLEPVLHRIISKYLSLSKGSHIRVENLPSTDFDVIHGHFKSDRFEGLLPTNHLEVVVLRDPLERMVSHFKYWRRTQGAPTHRVQLHFDPEMDFETYAFHPSNLNYQAQALAGKPLPSFGVVGVMDNMVAFVEELTRRTQTSSKNRLRLHKLNTSSDSQNSKPLLISGNFAQVFREAHYLDYELYQQARALAAQYY